MYLCGEMFEGAVCSLVFLHFIIMIDKELLKQFINEKIADTGLFLVDVAVTTDNEITVELEGYDRDVSIDDCVALNNAVLDAFDRDKEDYQLEIGSAGLTSPFKVKAQYDKNIGNEVEVLTADGKKMHGVLASASDESFAITVEKKVKVEGKKRPELVEETIELKYNEIKYTKYLIQFK